MIFGPPCRKEFDISLCPQLCRYVLHAGLASASGVLSLLIILERQERCGKVHGVTLQLTPPFPLFACFDDFL